MLKAEAKIDLQNNNNDTALMFASANRHLEIVQKLIKAEAKIDLQNNNGITALMIAFEYGDLEIIKEFIFAGADPTIKNKDDDSIITKIKIKIYHCRQMKLLNILLKN